MSRKPTHTEENCRGTERPEYPRGKCGENYKYTQNDWLEIILNIRQALAGNIKSVWPNNQ